MQTNLETLLKTEEYKLIEQHQTALTQVNKELEIMNVQVANIAVILALSDVMPQVQQRLRQTLLVSVSMLEHMKLTAENEVAKFDVLKQKVANMRSELARLYDDAIAWFSVISRQVDLSQHLPKVQHRGTNFLILMRKCCF